MVLEWLLFIPWGWLGHEFIGFPAGGCAPWNLVSLECECLYWANYVKYTRCCLIYCLSTPPCLKEERGTSRKLLLSYYQPRNKVPQSVLTEVWGVGCGLLKLNSLQDMDLALPWNPYQGTWVKFKGFFLTHIHNHMVHRQITCICSHTADSCKLVPYSIMGYSCQEGPPYVKWVLRHGGREQWWQLTKDAWELLNSQPDPLGDKECLRIWGLPQVEEDIVTVQESLRWLENRTVESIISGSRLKECFKHNYMQPP